MFWTSVDTEHIPNINNALDYLYCERILLADNQRANNIIIRKDKHFYLTTRVGLTTADQCLCVRYIDSTTPILPKHLAIFCGRTVRFVSNLVENPKDMCSINLLLKNREIEKRTHPSLYLRLVYTHKPQWRRTPLQPFVSSYNT